MTIDFWPKPQQLRSLLKDQIRWMIESKQLPEMTDEQIETYLDSIHPVDIQSAINQGLKTLVLETKSTEHDGQHADCYPQRS